MHSTGWAAVPGSGSTGRETGRGSGSGRGRRAAASVAAIALVSAALFGGAAAASAAPPASQAPGAPGAQATWTTGAKQGVGTSTTTDSKVWYTPLGGHAGRGLLPARRRREQPQPRARSSPTARRSPTSSRATRPTRSSLADPRRWCTRRSTPTRTAGTRSSRPRSPIRPARRVIIDVSVDSLDGGTYAVFALYDPSLANSGRHDSARFWRGALVAEDTAGDDTGRQRPRRRQGLRRDLQRLRRRQRRLDRPRRRSPTRLPLRARADGNVVQTAELKLAGPAKDASATLVLGFGASADAARTTADASSARPAGADAAADAYADGWHDYLDSVSAGPASVAGDASSPPSTTSPR